ncbi:MAG: hypothetical protein ABI404_18390 [Bradyrhizobium sp.]
MRVITRQAAVSQMKCNSLISEFCGNQICLACGDCFMIDAAVKGDPQERHATGAALTVAAPS